MFLTYFYLNFSSRVTIQKYLLFFFHFENVKKNFKTYLFFSFSFRLHISLWIKIFPFYSSPTVHHGVISLLHLRSLLIGFLYNFAIKWVLVYFFVCLMKKHCVKRESQRIKNIQIEMGREIIRGSIQGYRHTQTQRHTYT
jgi:hypothetical protein